MIRILLAVAVLAGGCASERGKGGSAATAKDPSPPAVRLGIESFVANPPAVVRGKRVGLITNHTGANGKGESAIDLLRAMKSVQLVALFGPEHGIRGDAAAGAKIGSTVDEKTGIPVHSLYGSGADSRKPKPEMLKDVDVLMFDIQDVGARCYTYPYTMALGMQAAKENGKPFVVLDRPNPIGGEMIESNLLDPKFSSFVGMYSMPMRHGMTVGELAQLFNKEFGIGCDLHVVKMQGWTRDMWWDQTGLTWVAPSPNLPRLEAAIHYPGTVAFEGTNLSCGRGTSHPFEQVGAPWLDAKKVVAEMSAAGLPGVTFEAVEFTPVRRGGSGQVAESQVHHGVRLTCTDRNAYQPVRTGAVLVAKIREAHPNEFKFRTGHFDVLAGTDKLRASIEAGTLDEFLKGWEADAAKFRETRKPYLLYQ